jgi:hypothetical protein
LLYRIGSPDGQSPAWGRSVDAPSSQTQWRDGDLRRLRRSRYFPPASAPSRHESHPRFENIPIRALPSPPAVLPTGCPRGDERGRFESTVGEDWECGSVHDCLLFAGFPGSSFHLLTGFNSPHPDQKTPVKRVFSFSALPTGCPKISSANSGAFFTTIVSVDRVTYPRDTRTFNLDR